MAVIQAGTSGSVLAEVDPATDSLRVNIRPIVSATLGSYSCSLNSGTMAAALAANATIWSFRYSGANICIVEKVIFDGLGLVTAMGTAQAVGFGLFACRSFTANATGGTTATLTGNNCKMRTSYATTGVADIRISSTAVLTTAGTRTPDSQPFGGFFGGAPVTAGSSLGEATLFDAYKVGHPVVLATNEGLEIQNRILWGAGGTWTFGITVQWTEVTTAEWGS